MDKNIIFYILDSSNDHHKKISSRMSSFFTSYIFNLILATPRKVGESCGACLCPPTFNAGKCEEELECVTNPMLLDSPGKCMAQGQLSLY